MPVSRSAFEKWYGRLDGCRALLDTTPTHGSRGEPHTCRRPFDHHGLHQCWCELLFDDNGLRYIQKTFWSDVGLDLRSR